jgi:hypothetical protein
VSTNGIRAQVHGKCPHRRYRLSCGQIDELRTAANERCQICGPGVTFPPPNWGLDFIDFPTGWHIARLGVLHTDRRCSYIQTWGAILCDCGAIEAEWARRRGMMSQ